MSRLDRSLIAGLPLFSGMSSADLDKVLERATSRRVPKDALVFEQDSEVQFFYLLLHGRVRVVKTTADGQQVIVRYIGAGELLGIAQALGRTTYPASAVAVVDCVVLAWPSHLWAEFAAAFSSFGASTYKTVGERLQDVQSQVVELATQQVERRVAHALLRLVQQTGKKSDDGLLIDFPISRQDIAEMTGATLYTVSRLLSAWEQEGLIESGRQRITVLEPHRLLLIAEGRLDKD